MSERWNWDALLAAEPPARPEDRLQQAVEAVLVIRKRETLKEGENIATRWLGSLRVPPAQALAELTPPFARDGYTAMVQEHGEEVAIVAAPGIIEANGSRLWLALLLFVLTVISTFLSAAPDIGPEGNLTLNWTSGLTYSGTLLSILLAHEMGHYLASRHLKVTTSYPFFIPMLPQLSIFGTLGAFIQMKEPPPDRRALFTIAVAGPLAGLALAIPLTLIGLSLSTVQPLPEGGYVLEGNNLLYGALKWIVFGRWLPADGVDVTLHPMAWAGWAGLLVTALNLLPAGQLDGGHIIFALLGRRRGRQVTYGVIGLLLLLGFVWEGWWIWALLISLLARRHAPILDDITPLTPQQRLLALVAIIIFVLLFTPTPLVHVPAP